MGHIGNVGERATDKAVWLLCASVVISLGGGCHGGGNGAAGATPATGSLTGGGGDHCADARLIAAPATIVGDLTTRTDDSNARIEVTGYAWAGRDDFFAMDLQAGQTVTLALDDHSAFDGGIYVFQNCANIPGTVVGGLDTNVSRPFVFSPPAAGHYIFAVDSWIANTGGPYTLTVTPGGTPTAAAAAAAPAAGDQSTLHIGGNSANYGVRPIAPGFVPDPISIPVVSGGGINVATLGHGSCNGWVTAQPDMILRLSGNSGALRLYVTANAGEDTTLVVNTAGGQWMCNDDSYGGRNPTVNLPNMGAGQYDVWIGSYQQGVQAHAVLHVTELDSNHP